MSPSFASHRSTCPSDMAATIYPPTAHRCETAANLLPVSTSPAKPQSNNILPLSASLLAAHGQNMPDPLPNHCQPIADPLPIHCQPIANHCASHGQTSHPRQRCGQTAVGSARSRTAWPIRVRSPRHPAGAHGPTAAASNDHRGLGCARTSCGACALHGDGRGAPTRWRPTKVVRRWVEGRQSHCPDRSSNHRRTTLTAMEVLPSRDPSAQLPSLRRPTPARRLNMHASSPTMMPPYPCPMPHAP